MNEDCGCCEGVEEITPVSNTNRPGLSALVYRVGTHATFLETMLARLASFSFESPSAAETYPARPLMGLATREASDAAIAFLDAWALVADVLTFYQERIANEGFLRTATERRSVLELARLLGYQPRPGVAASVYLAYTLDPGSEVVVPQGTRSQSVPGPEELPQAFETAEDLKASALWNTLQPRLTRPQSTREQGLIPGRPLYLKGTATNLKPNDPLLVDLDGLKDQRLFRVTRVEPDQAADRTKVTYEPWMPAPAQALPTTTTTITAATAPASQGVLSVAAVRALIARHRRAEDFGVNANTRTAERILNLLSELESGLTDGIDGVGLRRLIEEKLPSFREEYRLAREGNFTKLAPWIGSIISELEDLIASAQPEPGPAQPSLLELSRVLNMIRKPPARNPSSRQQLGRSVTEHFDPASDALPKLLTTFQPALSQSLYRAWKNVPVTQRSRAQVYALRTRASVFGHNAPPRPVIVEGKIERYEEWTLSKPTEGVVIEHFHIDIAVRVLHRTEITRESTINIRLEKPPGTVIAQTKDERALTLGTYVIPLTTIDEEVSVTVHNMVEQGDDFQMTIDFTFKVRGVTVKVDLSNNRNNLFVTCTGIDSTVIGYTAQLDTTDVESSADFENRTFITIDGDIETPDTVAGGSTETPTIVSLDATYDQILPGSWVAVERPASQVLPQTLVIYRATSVREATRADYGITAKGTQLQLNGAWLEPGDQFRVIRESNVLAQSEPLELAEAPLDPIEEAICGNRIELADLVEGLEPGRWLLVTGERTDIVSEQEPLAPRISELQTNDQTALLLKKDGTVTEAISVGGAGATATGAATEAGNNGTGPPAPVIPGVKAAELMMLAGIEQGFDENLPGDATHTTLLLARDLAYCYKPDTVRIYGNVVRATHGETRREVLGSGDASQSAQSFPLRQSPLTYTAAPTPSGVESALEVRVNDILWHKTETLAGLSPKDRSYVTKTDDQDQTTIIFGNGREGARLPTGVENVLATYRTGIGQAGNVQAEQINIVVTKPLGVKEVINPLAATGGANREDRDQVRSNAPLAVTALDRLISTRDYEDFARTFAGIGKASAVRLSDGQRQLVHLTIAGTDDIPVSEDSDLYKNLREALLRFGDPFQAIKIARRFLKLLVVSAKVRLDPDYIWEAVEPQIRSTLLERFSFRRRDLGQDVVLSEVISTIQRVEGVVYVDVDTLDAIEEDIDTGELLQLSATLQLNTRIRAYLAQVDRTDLDPATRIRPAQLALLTASVPETLVLTELK
jgi:hypothetical protein